MSIPKTQKAALVRKGSESPDAIEYADVASPQISQPTDVIIKNSYAGVNFSDVYFRKNADGGELPHIFGREAAGTVAAVGEKVTKYKVGDKVAYLSPNTFAQYTKVAEDRVPVKILPEYSTKDDLKKWAAILLQGLTAISLATEAYEVKKGDFILLWAAAGGVGQIITKFSASRGARVIAVASSDEKLQIAKNLGAEFLVKSDEDVAAKVSEITNGKGVIAAFDSVGKDTFDISLESLGRKGTFVNYGAASGPVPPFSLSRLQKKNLNIIGTALLTTVGTPEDWKKFTDLLEDSLEKGTVDITISKTYPLSEYAKATTELEGRRTTGKTVLEIP